MKSTFLFKRSILIVLLCSFLNILFAQHTLVTPDCIMQTRSMTFRAYIDGSEYIHVLGNKVWYVHRNFQLPGKSDGSDEPTYINGNVWFPLWKGDISNKYTLLSPPLVPPTISNVIIEKISGRGPVILTQIPNAGNNYEAIILADDDPPDGPDWYEFRLKWTKCLPAVSSFTLINADTDKDIRTISDGSIVDINTLPTPNLNIRANTNSAKPGSVVFILDGKQVRTEEGSPFAIAGDLPTGDYHAWILPMGEHTLTAIPYEKSNGGGLRGKSLTIGFNVIIDTDGDGVPDDIDNCPTVANADQLDTDNDGIGDACDPDDDNDGTSDVNDCAPVNEAIYPDATEICGNGVDENCNGIADDVCVVDTDGDGVRDNSDNCPSVANPDQLDTDSDGMGDVCDTDDDNDGRPDASDCAPLNGAIHPGAAEVCNNRIDDNCNGRIDEDCNGFCGPSPVSSGCLMPANLSTVRGRDNGAFLNWGVVGVAKFFQVVIVSEDYKQKLKDTVIANTRANQNQYWAKSALFPNGLYHWKVRSICDNAKTQFSEWNCSGLDFIIPFPGPSSKSSKPGAGAKETTDLSIANTPSSLGIKTDINSTAGLTLMPNPANNILNIYTTGLQNNQKATLSVISGSGALLKTKKLNGLTGNIQLNVSSLVSGMYTLKLISGDKVIYKKFVKL